jgi:arylsulfatase A-like enzyme
MSAAVPRTFLLLLLLACCPTCRKRPQKPEPPPPASQEQKKPAARPPNLVLISIDTLRRDHLTIYGYDRDTAPALQKLAKRSVIFDQVIVQNTNTAPSHATMFTGLYPTTHGITRNGMQLRPEVKTLAGILKQNGYATGGSISGWSLTRHTGLQRGFDFYDDMFAGSRRPGQVALVRARPWLQKTAREKRPFFLFLHLFDPHAPYDPPHAFALRFLPDLKKLLTLPERQGLPGLRKGFRPPLSKRDIREYEARYDGEIVYSDRVVRRLFADLKRLKAYRNSLIVFLSDHGETLFEREWVTDHGARAYEEQIRVPLLIRFPDKRGAGKRIAGQVEMVDLLPTVLETLRLAPPPGLPGRSLLPLIEGKAPASSAARRMAFSSARPEPMRVPEIRGVALTRYGLISTVRIPPLKLIEYPVNGGGWYRQLFNLQADPLETNNLADEQPELCQKLHQELERWRAATGGGHRAPPPKLSPDVERALRALGYVE